MLKPLSDEVEVRLVVANNFRDLLQARGYTAVEPFGKEHGIDPSVLSRLLRNQRTPRLETLVRIAMALGVTLDALFPMGS